MSTFTEATAEHYAALLDEAGEAAVYSRGVTTANVNVLRMRSGQRVTGDAGVFIIGARQDFTVAASDLSGFSSTSPERGDRITIGSEVFEVQPEVGGNEAWRNADHAGEYLRIHTARRAS